MDNLIFKEVKGTDLYNARDLHNGLESKQEFANWIKKRIKDCQFIEGEDYLTIDKKVKRQILKEYHITLDSCKNIAMMERNEVGLKVRKWFIEREKQLQLILDKEKQRLEQRNYARLEAPQMSKALVDHRAEEGKETKGHHYSNEHNLVYIVALGCRKKQYMDEVLEISNDESLRDNLTPLQIEMITHFQRLNTSLIELGFSYKDRKDRMNEIYRKKYADRVKEEIDRIEG